MGSSLEALHIDLIEHIVIWLEFSDIAALRLTSRVIEAKVSIGRFNSFFNIKKIDLTTKSLQRFVKATEKGQRGCLLQHCTIRGIIRADTPAQEDRMEHQRLLAKALHNLKQGSPEKSLASLSLCLTVRVEDSHGDSIEPEKYSNGPEVWKAALRTFHVAMAALHESQLPVNEHLDIFSSVRGCSLGCDSFLAEFAPESALTGEIFGSLKKLSARLSAPPNLDKVAGEHASESESDSITQYKAQRPPLAQSGWQADRVLGKILHVLPTMAKLESLDLRWYMLKEDNDSALAVLPVTAHQGSGTSSGRPHLKECHLRGVYSSETDLFHFLSALHPTRVMLTYTRLTSGVYTPVFRYLTSPDSPVLSYHLDDIYEGGKLVHFAVSGLPKFPYLGHPDIGPSTLSREESQIKEAIQYCFTRKRPLGSPQRTRWRRFKAQEFGGDGGGPYEFVTLNTQPENMPLWAGTDDD